MGEREPVFTDQDAGVYLAGEHGWFNQVRVVGLSMGNGMDVTDREVAVLEEIRTFHRGENREPLGSGDADPFAVLLDPGGLAERATDYLQSLTAEGLVWEWYAGELSLKRNEPAEDQYEPMFCVLERTHYGDFFRTVARAAPDVTRALLGVLELSPYNARMSPNKRAKVLNELRTTGKSDHGWARYTLVERRNLDGCRVRYIREDHTESYAVVVEDGGAELRVRVPWEAGEFTISRHEVTCFTPLEY